MRRVAFVPADAKARAANPAVRLLIQTAKDPWNGSGGRGKGQRPVTVPEAVQRAGKQGWVRLSELPEGEQRRWREAFRKTKGQK